ncbi:MAG: hypothetical protein C0614_08870 [Desulfuromonas sp.]|nr:MAG: hypothetical protein C0614_08870 [Desulfuromonas sp.]
MTSRRFRRVPFVAEVEVSQGLQCWTGILADIALKGALVEMSGEFPGESGAEYHMGIGLPGSGVTLEFQARLVHAEPGHFGFKFLSEDITTLTHLRKLIELNTGDSEATRSELSVWLQG